MQPQPSKKLHVIRGTIEKIVSHDPDTGYTVLKVLNVRSRMGRESIIAHLPTPYVGVKMIFYGEWHFHNGAPPVLQADYAYELKLRTLTELRKYLRSGIIKGIGHAIVKNIVKHFRDKTLIILNNDIQRLIEVKGISEKMIPEISNSWGEHKLIQEIMRFLQHHGLRGIHAVRAYNLYRGFTIEKTKENPYRLIQEIDDISFIDVDPVALSIGVPPDSQKRLSAAVMHIFSANTNFGHCYLSSAQIYEQVRNLLKIDISEKLSDHLRYMREKELVRTRKQMVHGSDGASQLCYYKPDIFFDESYVGKNIAYNNIPPGTDLEWVKDLVSRYRMSELNLSEEQADAVIGIVCDKYSVLTGNPGTGKTATLKAIVYVLKAMALKFHLVAPTGRAAQRMKELIGEDAKTIHRQLGWQYTSFRFNEKNPLTTDFVIIDESSMLDIHLTASLLKAVPGTSQVLFVGDPDQLPSIGPGNVLKDIIDSKAVTIYRLSQVFRQDNESLITDYATQINQGLVPNIDSPNENPDVWETGINCLFLDSEVVPEEQTRFYTHRNEVSEFQKEEPLTPYHIRALLHENHTVVKTSDPCSTLQYGLYAEDLIAELYTKIIPKHYDNAEIQILAPITGKSLGTNNLNRKIQETANPFSFKKRQLRIGNKTFRTGDRVIHCRNNYDLGIFNGEIGIIKEMNVMNFTCSVAYNGDRSVTYNHQDLVELDLAYAVTVHKAQGSEFDVVIIPIHEQYNGMLFRSLFYTALTRARKAVIFVGERNAFEIAVRNGDRSFRQTGLKELLIGTVN